MNFINLLFIVLGLVFGSYISALSYRIPKSISNIKGRSFCDKCKKNIRWYDNIPLLSYVILGGKCRDCRKKISLRYPLIEIITGLTFYYIVSTNYPDFLQIIYLLLVSLILIAIFVVDLEHKIIPDQFVFFGIFTSFIYLLIKFDGHMLFSGVFAGFTVASFLILIHLFTKGKGMGLGDVKFAVFGGMFIGLKLLSIWLLLAFLTGGIVGSILILGKKAKMKDQIAFGPFLILALVLAFIFGEKIMTFLGL